MTTPEIEVGDDLYARSTPALARMLDRVRPWVDAAYDARATGVEHLRSPGAALVVGNHSGGPLAMFEPLVLAHALRRGLGVERMPHLLLHEVMWRTPFARGIAKLGAVRASRLNADGLLARGEKVLVYPGGDREPFRHFLDRDRIAFGERRGYLQMAIAHGVPVVPVVTAGMHSGFVCLGDGHALAQRLPLARSLRVGVLPTTLSFPFGLTFGAPPPYVPIAGRVRIRVLPPIQFTRSGAEAAADKSYVEACHRTIVNAMQRALSELSTERRDERRAALHGRIDAVVDTVASLAPRFLGALVAARRVAAHASLDRMLDAIETLTQRPRAIEAPTKAPVSLPPRTRAADTASALRRAA